MENNEKIREKAMCLLIDSKGQRILAGRGYDKVKKENFFRVLGGSLENGENVEDGIRREIREELNCKIENLKFVGIIDNRFEYEGNKGHEIVHLFQGNIFRKELENQNVIHIVENSYEFDAEWISIEDILENKVILYPANDYNKILR